jgi:hypothetical protein
MRLLARAFTLAQLQWREASPESLSDRKKPIGDAAQVVRDESQVADDGNHPATASHLLYDRNKVSVTGEKESHLMQTSKGSHDHVDCEKGVDTLLPSRRLRAAATQDIEAQLGVPKSSISSQYALRLAGSSPSGAAS